MCLRIEIDNGGVRTPLLEKPAVAPRRARLRRGQALVEFALVALVLYLLIAFVLDFGRAIYGTQITQGAADLAARELSHTPVPAADTFQQALALPQVAQGVYTEDYLAIDVSAWMASPGGLSLQQYVSSLSPAVPPVNQTLVPLMFISTVGGKSLLRYPGALVTSATAPSGYTVKVPVVQSRDAQGHETISWVDVLEEVLPAGVTSSTATSTNDPFSLMSPQRGLVAVRINYPFQAAAMSSFQQSPNGPMEPNGTLPNQADDGAVTATNSPNGGGTPTAPDTSPGLYSGTYGGAYGLGQQGALGEPLRPYRTVVSAQAIYRREVFSD